MPFPVNSCSGALTLMKHLLELLKWDHLRFSALLNYLIGIVDGVEQDNEPDYAELIELITYLKPGLKGRHQAEEQALWQTLLQYAGPRGQIVTELEAIHQSVIDSGEALENDIRTAQEGSWLSPDRLRQLTDDFVRAFREQMEIEEQSLFPLVESVIPDIEWCGDTTSVNDRGKPLPSKIDWQF